MRDYCCLDAKSNGMAIRYVRAHRYRLTQRHTQSKYTRHEKRASAATIVITTVMIVDLGVCLVFQPREATLLLNVSYFDTSA